MYILTNYGVFRLSDIHTPLRNLASNLVSKCQRANYVSFLLRLTLSARCSVQCPSC
jgi:hypothetical protein